MMTMAKELWCEPSVGLSVVTYASREHNPAIRPREDRASRSKSNLSGSAVVQRTRDLESMGQHVRRSVAGAKAAKGTDARQLRDLFPVQLAFHPATDERE